MGPAILFGLSHASVLIRLWLSFSNVFSFTRLYVKYSLFKQYINKHTCLENLSQRITQNYKNGVNKLARAIYDFVHNIAGSQLCVLGKLSADDILKDLSCFSKKIGVNIADCLLKIRFAWNDKSRNRKK